MTPYDDNRVGLLVTDYKLTIPWVNVPTYFTDVFLPGHNPQTTKEVYDKAKADGQIRGTKTQLWYDATHGEAGGLTAEKIHNLLTLTKHDGGVEANHESPDDGILSKQVRDFYVRIRQLRPTRVIGINLAPLKGYVMPLDIMAGDKFLHFRIQNFYGNEMRPADMDECKRDFTERGWPESQVSFCYSAKARKQTDGTTFCDLPVFADGGVYVRRLRKGSVFNLNLMREAQLL